MDAQRDLPTRPGGGDGDKTRFSLLGQKNVTQHNKLLMDGDTVMVGADRTTPSERTVQKGREPGAPLRPRSQWKPLSGRRAGHRLGLEGLGSKESGLNSLI